jgi:hypothetical protein
MEVKKTMKHIGKVLPGVILTILLFPRLGVSLPIFDEYLIDNNTYGTSSVILCDIDGDGIFTGVYRRTDLKGPYQFLISNEFDAWKQGKKIRPSGVPDGLPVLFQVSCQTFCILNRLE